MRAPDTLDPAVERELAALDAALSGDGDDPVLAELAALVRDERPVPTPRWADALDERVAAGFPKPPRRRRRLRLSFGPAMAAVASVFLVLLVGGAALRSGGADHVRESSSGGGSAATSEPMEGAGEAAGDATPRAGEITPSTAAPPSGADVTDQRSARRVERSAYLTLAAPGDELAGVGDQIVAVTDRLGGFVRSSSVQSGETGGGGSFELRVPAGRLDRVLAELSRLAHVRERSQATQDITTTTSRARERLSDARAERRALRRTLDRATTTEDVARARAALRRIGREIDAAERSLRRVDVRAAFATVQVALVADEDTQGAGVPGDGRWTPREALGDAVRVLEVVASVTLVALAAALPFLLLLAPALLARRWRLAHARERALDAV